MSGVTSSGSFSGSGTRDRACKPRSCLTISFVAGLLTILVGLPASAQSVLYVDANAAGPVHDGASWCRGYLQLQDALAAADASAGTVTEIHVADGMYRPDQGSEVTPGDRETTFQLINGVALRGGYAGCGAPDPDERDISLNKAILSGDLSGNDVELASPDLLLHEPTRRENSYHVVTGSNTDNTALLDGFTITGGNASPSWNRDDENGAGMYNKRGDPTLIDCRFLSNSACYAGGGMHNVDSNATLTNCAFVGNFAGSGGGMHDNGSSVALRSCTFSGNSARRGGGMDVYRSEATMAQCVFLGNSADYGGGVYTYRSNPGLTQCTFSGNSADFGGGIYASGSDPALTNCTFSSNTAEYSGGGMFNERESAATLANCILWGNSDARVDGRRSQIFDTAGSLTLVTYSAVQDNLPHDGDILPGVGNIDAAPLFVDVKGPDGIHGTGDEDLGLLPRSPCIDAGDNTVVPPEMDDFDDSGNEDDPIHINVVGIDRFYDDPCTLDVGNPDPLRPDLGIVDMGVLEYQGGPPGDPDGDGLMGCDDNCPLHANPEQTDCDSDGLGDRCALVLRASRDCNGNEVPDECDIAAGTSADVDNDSLPDECQAVYYVDNDAPLGGDGLAWETAFAFLQDALSASRYGDAIHVATGTYKPDQDEAGGVTPDDREATFQLISGVAVRGGYRGCDAGACVVDPDERDVMRFETILSGDLDGDDVEVASPELLLDEPTRGENSFHVVTGTGTDDTAVLDGFTISGGNAAGTSGNDDDSGAGLYNEGGNPTLSDCTFVSNSAYYDGGGMYSSRYSSPMLANCMFSGNSAEVGGGMGNSWCSSPTLTDCRFSANWSHWFGGGMSNESSSPTLTNCTFSGNSANGGGGMSNWDESSPTLTDCEFSENSAVYNGGGVCALSYASPTLINCTFSRNSAGANGGGMSTSWRCNPTLKNCIFSANVAVVNGGGLFNNRSDSMLSNCTFSGNFAIADGGGVCGDQSGGQNAASASGPNPYRPESDPERVVQTSSTRCPPGVSTVIDCVFVGNSASRGGGVANSFSSPSVTNCVLWGDLPNELSGIGYTSFAVTHSDVQGGTGEIWFGEASIDADPMFVDPGHWNDNGTPDDPTDDFWVNGDYRLQAGSPCIDAGDNTAVPVDVLMDLGGKPRFVNDPLILDTGYGERPIVDMGAYERQAVLLDIRPGSCPNRLNTRSNARIRIAVVGTDVFDVSSIDMDSLMLQRADGVGGTVEPLRHGWRPMVFQQDVVTPFDGDLCDCHRMRRDSVDDLVVRFSTRDIVRELELRGISPKMPMPLTLHGLLLDGTPFEASDCILTTGRRPSGRERGISTGGKD